MSGRKVLLIAHHFTPANSAGVFRTVRFVKHLPEFEWLPVVVTATAGDSEDGSLPRVERLPLTRGRGEGRRSESTVSSSAQRQTPIRRAPGFQIVKNLKEFLTETPDQHLFWNRRAIRGALRLIREEKPEVIYTTGPPHSIHIAGFVLQQMTGLPWVADFRDPCARRPWSRERNPWGNRLLPRFERMVVQAADRVILNTDRATEDFRDAYSALLSGKFLTIPNGCDRDIVDRIESLTTKSRAPDADSSIPWLLHPGSCYGRRNPCIVLDAIAALSQQGRALKFRQVGHCAPSFGLLQHARDLEISELVSVEASVPHDEILREMAAADFLLLIQPEAPLMVPGKLYEMIAFRKPIVAVTDEGATADLMRKYQLGPVVGSSDVAGLTSALSTLLDRCSSSASNGSASAKAALDDFDGRKLTGRLAAVFDELTNLRKTTTEKRSRASAASILT